MSNQKQDKPVIDSFFSWLSPSVNNDKNSSQPKPQAIYNYAIDKSLNLSFSDYLKISVFSEELQNVKDYSGKENKAQKTEGDVASETEPVIDLSLDLDFTSSSTDLSNNDSDSLPSIEQFMDSSNVSYWIPTHNNLYEPLSLVFQEERDIVPNGDIPLLFFNDDKTKKPTILEFDNSGNPVIRSCMDSSVEKELCQQELKVSKRILLVPTQRLSGNRQILLSYAVTSLGACLKPENICWAMKYISPERGNVVVFEDEHAVNSLRKSLALEGLPCQGKLYFALCECDSNAIGIASDINSWRDGLKSSFDEQSKTLCPFAWRQICIEKNEKNLSKRLKDLQAKLEKQDEAEALYFLRAQNYQPNEVEALPEFTCAFQDDIVLEFQFAWLNVLSDILPNFREEMQRRCLQRDIEISAVNTIKKLCYNLTDKLYQKTIEQNACFPKDPAKSQLLRFAVAYCSFSVARKTVNNMASFLNELLNQSEKINISDRKSLFYTTKVSYWVFCLKELDDYLKNINAINMAVNSLKFPNLQSKESKVVAQDDQPLMTLVQILKEVLYQEMLKNDEKLLKNFIAIQELCRNNYLESLPSDILSFNIFSLLKGTNLTTCCRNLIMELDKKMIEHDRQYRLFIESTDLVALVYPALSQAMKPFGYGTPAELLKIISLLGEPMSTFVNVYDRQATTLPPPLPKNANMPPPLPKNTNTPPPLPKR